MPRAGETDEIWEELTASFGEPRTPVERGRRNQAVKQLREAGATPEEIRITIAYCERTFTHFTEIAVCGWLSRALKDAEQTSNVRALLRKAMGE